MEFTVLKTRIKISPLFFAVLTAFLISDKTGIAVYAILFSSLHEASHFLALVCGKIGIKELDLSVFGIRIILPNTMSTARKITVLMAGFTVNFILASFFFIIKNPVFGYINLAIGMMTAVPLSSTDGGEILKILMQEYCYDKSERIIKILFIIFGIVFIILLTAAAVYFKNYYIFIAVFYIILNMAK